MLIICGDYVRPNINLCLPSASVWCVIGTIDGLKLNPANYEAKAAHHLVANTRFNPRDFEVVTEFHGEWIPVKNPGNLIKPADSVVAEPDEPRREAKAVTKAREAVAAAIKDSEQQNAELLKARCIEAKRKADLRAAQMEAQRKEELRKAEAQARADAQRRALQARLHADRCLGEATLELIAAVSGLLNGQPDAPVHSSIALHVEQLQPLANVYGYRIVKPNTVALLVKL